MGPKKIRVKRGHAPVVIYPLPDKATFDQQWQFYMAMHGEFVNTDWGSLTRDQTWEKLTEIFNTSTDSYVLQRYSAWWNALGFQVPANPI